MIVIIQNTIKILLIFITTLLLSCSNDDNNPTVSESSVPELATVTIITITSSSANFGGNITSDGGETVTTCGVCWSTSLTPTVSDNTTNDWDEADKFTSKISGLTPETIYYVRAYATNSVGTGYGSTVSFTTFETGKGTLTDRDGNLYQIIKIGNQWWMAENLKVTHYRNGATISNVADNTEWANIITGAHCSYGNNPSNVTMYGNLYNWYAVDDSRDIAPKGWHVPTDEEWQELEIYLGMSPSAAISGTTWRGTDEGGKLKEAGTAHWNAPNTGATNESGFTALPGGGRSSLENFEGKFEYKNVYASLWSSSDESTSQAWFRNLGHSHSDVKRNRISKNNGFSVRCIMD